MFASFHAEGAPEAWAQETRHSELMLTKAPSSAPRQAFGRAARTPPSDPLAWRRGRRLFPEIESGAVMPGVTSNTPG